MRQMEVYISLGMTFNNLQQIDQALLFFFFLVSVTFLPYLYTRKRVGSEQRIYASTVLTHSSSIWATASGYASSNFHMLNTHMRGKVIFTAWKGLLDSHPWLIQRMTQQSRYQVDVFRSRLIFRRLRNNQKIQDVLV